MERASRLPRPLHPGAWWLWALGLATAASRTTNPLLLALILAVVCYVVIARRTDSPWARAFKAYLLLGGFVIVWRLGLNMAIGAPFGEMVLFALPQLPLPSWAAGIELGGPVTAEGLLGAGFEGLRLATLIICVGAANALVNPKRALRCLPAALYEVGVAVVVALTVAPQLVDSALRVRRARRLRGHAGAGLRAFRSVAVPVLEDALNRSLAMAAAMDSRGYGRTAGVPRRTRQATGGLVLAGLLGICVGTYALLDGTTPRTVGLPVLAVGLALAAGGLALGGRRVQRSRYRPDPWRFPEWLVAGSGLVAAGALLAQGAASLSSLYPSLQPLSWPELPPLAVAGVLVALAPAWLAPAPPVTSPPGRAPSVPASRRRTSRDRQEVPA